MIARSGFFTRYLAAALLAGVTAGPCAAETADAVRAQAIANLELGAVKYYFLQDRYFTAFGELQKAQRLPDIATVKPEADHTLADLYLALGLPEQAGDVLRGLSAQGVTVRPDAWLTLARQLAQRGYFLEAEAALANLKDLKPGAIQSERDYQLAALLLARKRYQESIAAAKTLQGRDEWSDYGRYNLGVALLQARRTQEALTSLDQLALSPPYLSRGQGLRNLVNVKLGYYFLKQNELDRARMVFGRVSGNPAQCANISTVCAAIARAESDPALLGTGWADYLHGDYRAAADMWTGLAQHGGPSAAVREAALGAARAHFQLKDYSAAIGAYEQALRDYESEQRRLNDAAAAIGDGSYFNALLNTAADRQEAGWTWRPDHLPDHAASAYLADAISRHDFQETFKNYRNLIYLQDSLHTAGADIEAYWSLLKAQRAHHDSLLPKITEYRNNLQRSSVLSEGQALQEELKRAETSGDVTLLASSKQKRQLAILRRFDQRFERNKEILAEHQDLNDKYLLLRGLLLSDLSKSYPIRLWEAKKAFVELNKVLADAVRMQELLQQIGERAKGNFGVQSDAFNKMRARQARLLAENEKLVAQHRDYLNKLLTLDLQARQQQLGIYLAQARLGLAQAYDQLATGADKKNAEYYNKAIVAYRSFINSDNTLPRRREAMQRLAYLEMLKAENRYNELMSKPAADERATADAANQIYQGAITAYNHLLSAYPGKPDNDRMLYQLANLYYNAGETSGLLDTLDRLAREYPVSPYAEEVQFRRGELLFTLGLSQQAAQAYGAVVVLGENSPYYEKALYKHGWSLYKENRHNLALESFLSLLERKFKDGGPAQADPALSRGDEEMINDVLRVASLSLSQLNGTLSLSRYFSQHGARPYEHRLYAALAELYQEQERTEDAAGAYRAFIEQHPNDPRAPLFHAQVLAVYEKSGFTTKILASKEEFVNHYAPDSAYWASNPNLERDATLQQVRGYIQDLAHYHHARAQGSKQSEDYRAAELWYRRFLHDFPADPAAAETHFLLAESLYENRAYEDAIREYERVAADYPAYPKRTEAAYASLLAYEKMEAGLNGAEHTAAQQRTIAALLRFAASYPADPRALATQIKAARTLFSGQDLPAAEKIARDIIARTPPAAAEYLMSAWRIVADSEFESRRYADAEKSYQEVLALTLKEDRNDHDAEERLAAAIYKQGEQAAQNGDHRAAAQHFLRVGQLAPGAASRVNADYDAAAQLLTLEDWPAAIAVLERFRKDYPAHPLQKNLSAKLAVAYQNNRDWGKAAGELEKLAAQGDDLDLKRDALWQSAELYVRSERPQDALRIFQQYAQQYPQPLADAVEAHQRVAELYAQRGDNNQQQQWLAQLVIAEQKGGAARNDRTRFLAAHAALSLAQTRYDEFARAKLTRPLEASLKLKKKAMEEALQAYRQAADYGVAGVTTAATHHTAEIYAEFGAALLNSERPTGLSELELEQYNVLLEEQAYPFEEQAIGLYEANARRSAENIYDEWVQKSFAALGKLLPARYSKMEKGEPYLDTLY